MSKKQTLNHEGIKVVDIENRHTQPDADNDQKILFCIRPTTRNVGNDVIGLATARLLLQEFGPQTTLVNIPALAGPQYGGITARQVYDMNRLADGVVIGGGNLFENGQITLDLSALNALNVPIMILGVSHARICAVDPSGCSLTDRSDRIPDAALRALVAKASTCHVRDLASVELLAEIGLSDISLGGCPTLFLPRKGLNLQDNGAVLLSIRHPERMSVPPSLQWRIPQVIRQLITALSNLYGMGNVRLVCHDYKDLEFAKAFTGTQVHYFDGPEGYLEAMSRCRQSVSFRLHAFLPCFAMGVPSVHLSYDERGNSMMKTVGMEEWNVNVFELDLLVDRVIELCNSSSRFEASRAAAQPKVDALQRTTASGLAHFSKLVTERSSLLARKQAHVV